MQLLMKPVDQIRPNPRNPRTHSKKQIHQIAASIQALGFHNPLLIDERGVIIAGHGRLAAAQQLGLVEVPVIEVHGLSSAQKSALMLADNRIAQNAGWNLDLLAIELRDLSTVDLDFDLAITGFETAEIDILIDGQGSKVATGCRDDQAPAVQPTAVTKPGDLWYLGEHKLLCAEARESTSYSHLMADEKATVAFADPPYNVKIDGHVCGSGAIKHREFAMASGEMNEREFTRFLTQVCQHAAGVSHDGALHFVCMDWRHLAEITAAGRDAYSELKNVCVWNKDNGGMGSLYRAKYELIFVFKVGTARHINNIELGRSGRYRTNVWDYAGVNTMRAGRMEDLAMHPTVKPVALVADAIKDCSRRSDIVLDPFCGSGTTIIAAQKTGRRARALEIDPLYVDVAVRRWQIFSGQDAVHQDSGRTFNEIERSALLPSTIVQPADAVR